MRRGIKTPLPAPGGEDTGDSAYWQFYDAVAARQLAAWLPGVPGRVLDLSGTDAWFAAIAGAAGHAVLHRCDLPDAALARDGVRPVCADGYDLGWLRDAALDAVVAEAAVLSEHVGTEDTLAQLHRVLRSGGRLLLSVESLTLGLARLAGQSRWAELADVPSADVVLVPNDDGSMSRCFWPEELHAVLAERGFAVEWVRPRTVLSQDVVSRTLAGSLDGLDALVATELALAVERQGESVGIHLVASAVRV